MSCYFHTENSWEGTVFKQDFHNWKFHQKLNESYFQVQECNLLSPAELPHLQWYPLQKVFQWQQWPALTCVTAQMSWSALRELPTAHLVRIQESGVDSLGPAL